MIFKRRKHSVDKSGAGGGAFGSKKDKPSDVPVLIYTSLSMGRIALVKSLLISADIPFYVENELTTGYGPIISQSAAAGGMKVFVRPEDAQDAQEIIDSLDAPS